MIKKIASLFVQVLLVLAFTAGCSVQPQPPASPTAAPEPTIAPADLAQVLKSVEDLEGWKPAEDAKFFTPDNLYDLMNGQSDSYFVYGFQKAGVSGFSQSGNGSAPDATVIISVFEFDSPASAYGLFSQNSDGEPFTLGNEGRLLTARRITAWQAMYMVQITSLKPLADEVLRQPAEAIINALPKGGQTPEIMSSLPEGGKDKRYFHQELSIQDFIWLGGENKLGLGMDTGGALARYEVNGANAFVLVIDFPNTDRAKAGLDGLKAAGVSTLADSQVKGTRLYALFAEDPTAAKPLFDQAVGKQ